MNRFSGLKIIKSGYLAQYKQWLKGDLQKKFDVLSVKKEEFKDFNYRLASSSVFSSNIEGNPLDFNTYLKYKMFGGFKRTKEIQEIEDLISTYEFAQKNPLNYTRFLKSHEIFSKKILIKSNRGKIRKSQVGIYGKSGLVYMAIEPEYAENETRKLFDDISFLLNMRLSLQETFYFASMLHLMSAIIHPFMDGNGRASRLLEKWFLATMLGKKAWSIESEKYYFSNRPKYYKNIHLGVNYYVINYDRCLPFLLMLPASLKP